MPERKRPQQGQEDPRKKRKEGSSEQPTKQTRRGAEKSGATPANPQSEPATPGAFDFTAAVAGALEPAQAASQQVKQESAFHVLSEAEIARLKPAEQEKYLEDLANHLLGDDPVVEETRKVNRAVAIRGAGRPLAEIEQEGGENALGDAINTLVRATDPDQPVSGTTIREIAALAETQTGYSPAAIAGIEPGAALRIIDSMQEPEVTEESKADRSRRLLKTAEDTAAGVKPSKQPLTEELEQFYLGLERHVTEGLRAGEVDHDAYIQLIDQGILGKQALEKLGENFDTAALLLDSLREFKNPDVKAVIRGFRKRHNL